MRSLFDSLNADRSEMHDTQQVTQQNPIVQPSPAAPAQHIDPIKLGDTQQMRSTRSKSRSKAYTDAVSAERRSEIARMGAIARKNRLAPKKCRLIGYYLAPEFTVVRET